MLALQAVALKIFALEILLEPLGDKHISDFRRRGGECRNEGVD